MEGPGPSKEEVKAFLAALPVDKERKCKESMMDEYEERRIAWAKFSKKQCFKHSEGK